MSFRRLAWHRSWAIIGFGLFVSIWSVGGLVVAIMDSRDMLLLAILGELVVLRIIVRGFTGSLSKRQLRVDVPAGMLQLESGKVIPLDEVGALQITYRRGGQRGVRWYELRAAGIPDTVLYESPYDSDTKKRFDALGDAVLQSKLRRVLERPEVDAAYRAVPEATAEILEIAETKDRATSALAALARDHDTTIATRATQLLASLAPASQNE